MGKESTEIQNVQQEEIVTTESVEIATSEVNFTYSEVGITAGVILFFFILLAFIGNIIYLWARWSPLYKARAQRVFRDRDLMKTLKKEEDAAANGYLARSWIVGFLAESCHYYETEDLYTIDSGKYYVLRLGELFSIAPLFLAILFIYTFVCTSLGYLIALDLYSGSVGIGSILLLSIIAMILFVIPVRWYATRQLPKELFVEELKRS